MEVTDVLTLNNYTKKEINQIAGSLESKSKHPLAEAITSYIEQRNINILDVDDFQSVTGKGVKGRISEVMFYIGNKSLFKSNPELPNELIDKIEKEGKTVVIIGNDQHVVGLIGLMDKIRANSISTIMELREKNIKTIMLTGDNHGTAKAVSSKIGIDCFYAGLLPEDKVRIVDDLLDNGEHVAMVGDGVNDAPALARSNVGIAMGSAGSEWQ